MFYTIIKKLTEKSARGTFIHTENDDQKDNCNANDKHAHWWTIMFCKCRRQAWAQRSSCVGSLPAS